MKILLIPLTCLALATSGCILAIAAAPEQLKPVAQRYSSVVRGASRTEVETKLGQPLRKDGEASVWEERLDDINYVIAKVWFDAADKVAKVEVQRSKGTRIPGYSSRVNSTVVR